MTHKTITTSQGNVYLYDAMVNLMDAGLREELHYDLAPCTPQEFVDAYAVAHSLKFGETWEPFKEHPQL